MLNNVLKYIKIKHIKNISGASLVAVMKNPPACAGDMGSTPGPERSHMPWRREALETQLLSLCAGARELQLMKPEHSRARALQE